MVALKLEDIKEKLTADIGAKKPKKEEVKMGRLPEYTIRTMKDDLAEVGLESLEKEAKIAEAEREEIITPPEIEKRPEAEISEEFKVKLKRTPLPDAEELVAPAPENLPVADKKTTPPLKDASLPTPPGFKTPPPTPPAPEMAPEPHPRRKIPRALILGIIGIIIIGAIGGLFYWQGEKPKPEPQPEPKPQPTLSQSLLFTEQTKILYLSDEPKLFELLKQEAEQDQTSVTFKRIGILNSSTGEDQKFLSLVEIFQGLEIAVPPYFLSELEDNYTLAFYGQDNERRLILISQIKNIDNLKEQIKFWEETMADDLKSLFLDKAVKNPATSRFQDNNYNGVDIRYINFPEPNLTIDYAVVNKLFIITTSKESMYKTIDRIK